jgi:hypothetical protein
MMQQFQQFLAEHFFLLWCAGAVISVLVFATMSWRQISRGPQFPSLSAVNVLYRERFASGCSHRSLLTRFGGAQNVLRVVLTDSELWITTIALFRGIAGFYDLEHRIPVANIANIEDRGRSLLIDFDRGNGTLGRLELRLRDKDGFLAKLCPLIEGGANARQVESHEKTQKGTKTDMGIQKRLTDL